MARVTPIYDTGFYQLEVSSGDFRAAVVLDGERLDELRRSVGDAMATAARRRRGR